MILLLFIINTLHQRMQMKYKLGYGEYLMVLDYIDLMEAKED